MDSLVRVVVVWIVVFCVSVLSALSVAELVESRNGTKEVCRLGTCDKWDVVVIVLAKRDFSQFKFVRSIIRRAFEDCKWFNGDIRIVFFTKNHSFVDANDYKMKLQLPIQVRDGSQYDVEERPTIFHEAVSASIDHLNRSSTERGSYILVITDFQKNADDDKVENEQLLRRLMEKAIPLRIVQLTYDGDHKTTFMSRDLINSHRVSRVGDYVGRVQVFEAKNVMDHFKPCPPLSQNEKLTQSRTANQYRTQLWIERNIGATLIGGSLLVLAFLSVILAYSYHRMEKTKIRKNSTMTKIQGVWIK